MEFETGRDSKKFCLCEPILGVRLCAQDGGVLQNFVFPPFFVRTADEAVSKGGSLWSAFLVRSFSDEKE